MLLSTSTFRCVRLPHLHDCHVMPNVLIHLLPSSTASCPTRRPVVSFRAAVTAAQQHRRYQGGPALLSSKVCPCHGARMETFRARAKIWSPQRIPGDTEQPDEFGNNSDLEEDYSPPLDKAYESAKASAAASIKFRAHSRKELQDKLKDKGYDREVIKRALNRLEQLGLINDTQFAETYARSKWRQARWGPSRIRMELVRRGVGKHDVEHALRYVFGGDGRLNMAPAEPTVDHAQKDGANPPPLDERSPDDQLLEAAQRQANLLRGLPAEVRRRRLVGWLQRRGHSWSTVSTLLHRLDI